MKRTVAFTQQELINSREYIYNNYDQIVQFFSDNLELTPAFFNGKFSSNGSVTYEASWGLQDDLMKAQGITPHPLLGKCYHAVRFMQYLGGVDNFDAYLIKKIIPHKIEGESTTHWFLKDKVDGTIIDPTAAQFDYLDINDYYQYGRSGGGSLCYYGFSISIPLWDKHIPPVTTRKLTKAYKEQTGTAVAMEKWLQEEQWWITNKHLFPRKKKVQKNTN